MGEERKPGAGEPPIEVNADASSVQDVLAQDGGFVVVEPGGTFQLPATIDRGIFKEFGGDDYFVEAALKATVQYLNFPIVRDKFGVDHRARRVWREQQEKRFDPKEIARTEDNKLNKGRIAFILQSFECIFGDLNQAGLQSEQGLQLKGLIGRMKTAVADYDMLTNEDKIARVRQVEDVLHDFVKLFETA